MQEGQKLYLANSDFTEPVSLSLDRDDGLYAFVELTWSPTGDSILVHMFIKDPFCTTDCTDVTEYYLLEPNTLVMSDVHLERLGLDNVEYYQTLCGFTPDGMNLLVNSDGFYYFFDLVREETAQKIQTDGSCPFWLPTDLAYDDLWRMSAP